MAIAGDSGLLMEAIERNVAVVTTSTLLTTLRTIGFIWRQERQKQNVLEIAKEAGKLYDKFCAFVEDLQTLGKELDQAQRAYHAAFNKLSNSPRFGDTIIGRAERIRQLGASASKILPSDLRNEDEMRQGELPL
jgi:DNA recombination protein RmuC